MKTKFYFGLLAAAALSMTACSNENEPNNGGSTDANGDKYMAITIRNVGMNGSRAAATDDDFEAGLTSEGQITTDNLYFYFFDADGNPFQLAAANVNGSVATNVVKPTEIITNTHNPGQEPTITGVLVLGKAANEGYVGTTPSQVLCVVNPTATNLNAYANKPLSQVLDISTTNADMPAPKNFVMTSSTYVSGDKKVVATDVTGKFYETPDEAKEHPAIIYLERLAAKARVQGLGTYVPQYKNSEGEIVNDYVYKVDNQEVEFNVTLNGWRMTNISHASLAFKNVAADGNYFEDWNDANRHRCYWALSKVSDPLANPITSFNIWDNTQWTRGNFDKANATTNIAYCYENTQSVPTSATDRTSKATGILIQANVTYRAKGSTDEFKSVELLRWAGAYYTADVLKQMIIDNYNVTNSTSLTKDAVEFKKYSDTTKFPNRYYATVKNGDSTVNWDTNYNNIQWWKDGATSYYMNIAHLGGKFGVVRNHIYDYTVNGVIGLGVPGNDIENPEPEQETFLSAALDILDWRVVSNNVTLE